MIYILIILLSILPLLSCNYCPVNGKNIGNNNAKIEENLHIETYVSGLEVPWSFEFAKDGRLFITERPGRIQIVDKEGKNIELFASFNDVLSSGESGLMGLALHKDFMNNQLLYVCYTKAPDFMVQVKSLRVTKNGPQDEKIILNGIPGSRIHVGCRLKFGPDNKLYITTGDGADRDLAQRLDSLAGKTLRINDDGTIPADNPFVNTKNARPEIWSLGHRNAQGMDFAPQTGLLFQTEHGPSGFDGPGGGDEINIVERGQNYGWPIVHHRQSKEGFRSPLLEYTPALAPAGATFYKGPKYKEYSGNFFFACLRGERLMRIVLDGRKVVYQESLFKNRFGRIRNVIEGPDGALYFSTSNRDGRGSPEDNDDRILRFLPPLTVQ